MPDIDTQLRLSAPSLTVTAGAGRAVADLARSVAADPGVQPVRRRRTRNVVVAVVATACLGGTGIAAAEVLGARTGWFGAPGQTEADTSEWIDTSAPHFAAVAEELVPADLELPDDVDTADAVSQVVRQAAASPGFQQTTGIRGSYMFYARCQWIRTWLDDFAAGTASASPAASALTKLADQPAFRAVDGGGLRENLLAIVASARSGDPAPLRGAFAANCKGGLGDAPGLRK